MVDRAVLDFVIPIVCGRLDASETMLFHIRPTCFRPPPALSVPNSPAELGRSVQSPSDLLRAIFPNQQNCRAMFMLTQTNGKHHHHHHRNLWLSSSSLSPKPQAMNPKQLHGRRTSRPPRSQCERFKRVASACPVLDAFGWGGFGFQFRVFITFLSSRAMRLFFGCRWSF